MRSKEASTLEENITDIRIVKSKEKIKNALINLLNKYNFDEISVKDICKFAEISRGTFYLHYHDKNDLVLKYQKSVMVYAKNILSLISMKVKETSLHKLSHFGKVKENYYYYFYLVEALVKYNN